MSPIRLVPWVALAFLLFPPTVAALSVTTQPPTAPIPWNGSATMEVTIRASCATLLQDNQAQIMEFELSGSADAPWIAVSGEKVPWTRDQCDTGSASQATTCSPQPACAADYPVATTKGNVTLTPSSDAPGLTTIMVTVGVKDREGKATFPATVSYYGSLNVTVSNSTLDAAPDEEVRFVLALEALTNAKSMVMLSVKQAPAAGQVSGLPETVDIEPNVAYIMDHGGMMMWMDAVGAGEPKRVDVPLTFRAPASDWTMEKWTVDAQLMAYEDPSEVTAPLTAGVSFEPKALAAATAEESAPGLEPVLLAIAAVSVLAWRRRRTHG